MFPLRAIAILLIGAGLLTWKRAQARHRDQLFRVRAQTELAQFLGRSRSPAGSAARRPPRFATYVEAIAMIGAGFMLLHLGMLKP